MKPGRELDALIAEKVMGCHCVNGQLYPPEFNQPGIHEAIALPEYSTDIAAAWQVVERLRLNPKLWHFSIDFARDYGIDKQSGWSVVINGRVLVQFADTAPLAICLAALKTVD